MKTYSNPMHFLFIFWCWNLILIQSEFHLSAAVKKTYQYTKQDLQKVMGNSLPNAPSCVGHSEKNRQAAEEECYPEEIKLKSEGRCEDWRFTQFLKLVVNFVKLLLAYLSIDT